MKFIRLDLYTEALHPDKDAIHFKRKNKEIFINEANIVAVVKVDFDDGIFIYKVSTIDNMNFIGASEPLDFMLGFKVFVPKG